jgi:hypothetical protein
MPLSGTFFNLMNIGGELWSQKKIPSKGKVADQR